jgi:hypothetical protein
MGVKTDLTCPRGQNKTWTATYNVATNITGYNFAFSVRDTAGRPLFQLTSGAGITPTDPVNGVLTIQATAAQTLWPAARYSWDLWRTDPGFEDQLGYGDFTITPSYRV